MSDERRDRFSIDGVDLSAYTWTPSSDALLFPVPDDLSELDEPDGDAEAEQ